MLYLQIVFVLTFVCFTSISWLMWRSYRRHRMPPGVDWWAYGSGAIALTTLLAATSDYVGEWSRAVLAHVLLVGGFGAIWIGTQLFFGKRIVHWHLVTFGLSLAALGGFFYWYWIVNPAYQFRLAMGCVLLLLLSLGISQTFFAYRVGQGAVTAAGVFYSIFGFINGLRTVHIILFPDSHAYFLSGVIAKTLTSLMIPVLIAAMISQLAILRQENRSSDESDE